ncbi:MAG: hypothetical protein JWO67_3831 [Streptosporangiaceae bacterium]|nr:hypothetical protein [Streptosporangiaceae bacterium]
MSKPYPPPYPFPRTTPDLSATWRGAAYRRYCARPGTLTGRAMFDHAAPIGPAVLGPQLLTEARSWIADCWGEDESEELSDGQVERVIRRHYCGGLPEFIRNTNGPHGCERCGYAVADAEDTLCTECESYNAGRVSL